MRPNRAVSAALAFAGAMTTAAALAQPAWPTRPVRLVVPFAPGGGTDIVARLVAPTLGEIVGQSVLVDNRSGAAGNIAVEIVARAQPDGHTVLLNNVSTASVNPTLFAHVLKVRPEQDLTGVTLLAAIPNLLVSGAGFPATTVKELVAHARARPGQMNFSSPLGGYSHLDMLDFAARAGFTAVNVPSKGAGSSAASIIAGEIHFSIVNAASAISFVRQGRMRAYATTAAKRLPELPDVPTLTEAGYPGVGSDNWNGLFLPARTPAPVVDRLFAATLQALQRDAVREGFAKANVPIAVSASPAEFNAFVKKEIARWAKIIKDNNIRVD
jgi:tripartite-type tricarboxylate transporter receptor subunit TctC